MDILKQLIATFAGDLTVRKDANSRTVTITRGGKTETWTYDQVIDYLVEVLGGGE